jgi:uncharacterized membrane protein YfhO
MTLDVSHRGEGLLVVSEVYSENWKATIDGEAIDVLQTDHALLGIPVGPGEHTVELQYDPDALTLGLWISGLTAAGALAVVGYAGWARISRRTWAIPAARDNGRGGDDVDKSEPDSEVTGRNA